MGKPAPDAFFLDEEPLRKMVLKGYFGERAAVEPEPLVGHLRQLLSGPPGGETDPESYYFEIDPDRSLPAFLGGVEAERKGLAALVAEPLLLKGEELSRRRKEGPPNLTVFVSSLAGSVALKAEISEPVGAALLAGFLIAVARLGPARARALYHAVQRRIDG